MGRERPDIDDAAAESSERRQRLDELCQGEGNDFDSSGSHNPASLYQQG